MNVSAWSIRNPIPAVLLFLMLTLSGLMAFKAMRIQQFMDIDLPTVTVTAACPARRRRRWKPKSARKIENAVATLQGVKHIYTKVQDGTATVTVEFRLEKPTQEAVDDVRDAVSRIRADLPGDLRDPVITKMNVAGAPILTYTVASTRMDEEALSWFVDNTVAKPCSACAAWAPWRASAASRARSASSSIRTACWRCAPRRRRLAPVAPDPAGSLGRPRRRRRREQSVRTIATVQTAAEIGAHGNHRWPTAAACGWTAGHGQRHGGRTALGGAAQRQAGGRLRDHAQPGAGEVDVAEGVRAALEKLKQPSTPTSSSPRPSISSIRWSRTSKARWRC
jgi:hypothetical protein